MSEINANKSVNPARDVDCEIIDEGQQNDIVQTIFASTSIGKNVMNLNRCHVTIEKFYNEKLSCVQQMEEKKKKQTKILLVIQDGLRLFKDNLNKLKAVKGIQVREVHAIETEFKQYISVEAKAAQLTKKRVQQLSEEEIDSGKQTPSKVCKRKEPKKCGTES